MELEKFNANVGRRPKKSPRERHLSFTQNHHIIKVAFKKTVAGKTDSGKSEYDRLIKNASRYSRSISRFIRDCAMEPKIRVIEKHPLINEKLFLEVHRIGVNINQIAYKVNAKVDEKEFPEFMKELHEWSQKMDEVLEIIRSKWW